MTSITVEGLGERHLHAGRVTRAAQVAVTHRDRVASIAQGAALHTRIAHCAARLCDSGAATALGAKLARVVRTAEKAGYHPQGIRGAAGQKDERTIPEITVRVTITGQYETD